MATAGDDLRALVQPLGEGEGDYDGLLQQIGDARIVLLGEASHGTQEFYRERALITRRLIQEKGFTAVAVEADWPDAYRVNRFVQCRGKDTTARDALSSFERFPAWMWRNTEVLEFVIWLRLHNRRVQPAQRAGFYGIDLYSLRSSMAAVLMYLEEVDPAAAARARQRYACFDRVGSDPQSYGYMTQLELARSCQDEVVRQLTEMLAQAQQYATRDGPQGAEDFFDATLNARVVRSAEEYDRTMFASQAESWNLRDRHMMETLTALERHLQELGRAPRIVVWAHNSHLGDARATEMAQMGELNLGQLAREHYRDEVFALGMSTFGGTVTAAANWGDAAQTMRIVPGRADSYEALFHETGLARFLLDLRAHREHAQLQTPRLQRAIGVIYRPQTERQSHYFKADLPRQFDAMLHVDVTRALKPLAHAAEPRSVDEAETFPSGT